MISLIQVTATDVELQLSIAEERDRRRAYALAGQ